jgi:hypothetical protein
MNTFIYKKKTLAKKRKFIKRKQFYKKRKFIKRKKIHLIQISTISTTYEGDQDVITHDNYILSVWRRILSYFDYYDMPMDEETGLYNGLILPPTQHMYIFAISSLSLISGLYATSRGHYDLSLVPFGVFITSINYWRHPLFNSPRRYIDICYVHLSLLYQVYRAYNAEHAVYYYLTLAMSVAFFPLSWYYHQKKETWKGTFLHGMCHIMGNVSNIVLYSGNIHPVCF